MGYYPSGKLRFRYPIINEKFHGLCQCWYESGQLESEEHYANGILIGTKREWYASGNIRAETISRKSVEYYESGQIKKETFYVNGTIEGIVKKWHPNGQLQAVIPHHKGHLHGIEKQWYPDGELEVVWNYVNGSRHGAHKEWHANGLVRLESNYRNNVLHGILRRFYMCGKMAEVEIYIRGAAIGDPLKNTILSGALTAQYITNINSAVVRHFCLEQLGYERFLAQSKHQAIDKDGDQELVRIDWHRQEEPLYLVKVRCPSLQVFYVLRVPPGMKSVQQAIAWTFGVSSKAYQPQAET